jgi:hypothetical protein
LLNILAWDGFVDQEQRRAAQAAQQERERKQKEWDEHMRRLMRQSREKQQQRKQRPSQCQPARSRSPRQQQSLHGLQSQSMGANRSVTEEVSNALVVDCCSL